MTGLGFVLLIVGGVLVVAEAHVPGGILGLAGGVAAMAGGIIVIAALGGGVALALPVGLGLGAGTGAWLLVATRAAGSVRRRRVQAGAEGLCGQVGVVRRWDGRGGQIFVDGALWRARFEWPGNDREALQAGDHVVVERVSGLTLCVRRADEWERTA